MWQYESSSSDFAEHSTFERKKCDTKPVQRFRGSRSWCADGERDVFSRVRDDEEDAEEDTQRTKIRRSE